jgi:nucleoside-diphosphate-sugar epimerase
MTYYQNCQNQNLFSFKNIVGWRAVLGLILRVGATVCFAAVALSFAWMLFGNAGITVLLAQESDVIVPLVGPLSMLTFVVCAGEWRRNSKQRFTLSSKASVASVSCAVLAIAAAGFIARPLAPAISTLLTVFAGAISLLCLARVMVGEGTDFSSSHDGEQHKRRDDGTVLVIGGAGYVGSALVGKLLNAGFRVSVLDAMHFGDEPLSSVAGNPNLTLIREDFRHIEALTRAMSGVGSVIHLGGLVGDPACALDPELTVDINVTATKLVGEIAKACGVRRFIFASSCSVYGASDVIVDEDSRFNPQSLYARSKVASEVVLRALNCSAFAVTCLRFATIYGISGRTRFDLVVNLLCAKAVREGVITVFGADQWRPFVHVEDVARAIMVTLQAPIDDVAGEAFNVGSDTQNCTLGDAAELIKQQVPRATIVSDATAVDRRNYRVSFAKIRSRLGFQPVWTLERGISQVVALVRSNEIGHYSLPTYSNVLYLKAHGTQSFKRFKITGWENEFMSLDQISANVAERSAAA